MKVFLDKFPTPSRFAMSHRWSIQQKFKSPCTIDKWVQKILQHNVFLHATLSKLSKNSTPDISSCDIDQSIQKAYNT